MSAFTSFCKNCLLAGIVTLSVVILAVMVWTMLI